MLVVVGGIVVVVVLSDTKTGAVFETFPKLLLPIDNLPNVLPPNFSLNIIIYFYAITILNGGVIVAPVYPLSVPLYTLKSCHCAVCVEL